MHGYNVFSQTASVVAMTGLLSPTFLAIVLLIPMLYPHIRNMIEDFNYWFFGDNREISLALPPHNNCSYDALTWYIATKCDIKKAMFDQMEYSKISLETCKNIKKCDFGLRRMREMKLEHNNKKLLVRLKQPEKEFRTQPQISGAHLHRPLGDLILVSEYMKDITDFLAHITELHNEYRIKSTFSPTASYYRDGTWFALGVHNTKTRQNLFLEESVEKLLDKCLEEFRDKDFYQRIGINHKLGMLFKGPPGCGKTSTIYALAKEFQRPIYRVSLQPFKRGLELGVCFGQIPPNSIVVIEDIDCMKIAQTRDEDRQGDNILSDLLSIMDGNEFLSGCIVVFSSNYPEKLDSALIRAGRMDQTIEFLPASKPLIYKIVCEFYKACGKTKIEDEIRLEDIPEIKIPQSTLINKILIKHKTDIQAALEEIRGYREPIDCE